MDRTNDFTIDLSQKFEHLNNAPIVEAVIDFRARAEQPWEEAAISQELKTALSDYPKPQTQRGVSFTVPFSFNPSADAKAPSQEDLGWMGLRLTSRDGLQIATFTRDGFSFSRLRPYLNWEKLSDEALRIWNLHSSLAGVTAVQRLGVRFINRIDSPQGEFQLEDYFQKFESPASVLPLESFFHHDVLIVPGYRQKINVIRTIQPPQKGHFETPGLILDIDVFTVDPFPPNLDIIHQRLDEMRWLKNHIFFNGVTENVLRRCR